MEAPEIAGLNLEFLTSSEFCTKVAAWGKPTLGPWPWLLAYSQAPLPFPPPAPLSMCRAAPSKGVPVPACTSNFQLQLPETATLGYLLGRANLRTDGSWSWNLAQDPLGRNSKVAGTREKSRRAMWAQGEHVLLAHEEGHGQRRRPFLHVSTVQPLSSC